MNEYLDVMANTALSMWDLPTNASAKQINLSENTTYLVEAGGNKSILRVHRQNYHELNQIYSELAWIEALQADNIVPTANVIAGRDGKKVQTTVHPEYGKYHMVLFEYLTGEHPNENQDLSTKFNALGELAAKLHNHACKWQRPKGFSRHSWDIDAVFGPTPQWGDWREAPNVTSDIRSILERVEETIKNRLATFGTPSNRYGLIHSDMRLANLLIEDNATKLIDFDDCGFGWFLYDFAASVSFIEDHPQVPRLKEAWISGYQVHRILSDAEINEIDTFVMLRRMALLAWIGTHIDAPEPQALADNFAKGTAHLGEIFLKS